VIRILGRRADQPGEAWSSGFGAAGMPSDQIRKTAQSGGPYGSSASWLHRRNEQSSFASFVEKIIIDEKTIIIKLARRGLLLGADVPVIRIGGPEVTAPSS